MPSIGPDSLRRLLPKLQKAGNCPIECYIHLDIYAANIAARNGFGDWETARVTRPCERIVNEFVSDLRIDFCLADNTIGKQGELLNQYPFKNTVAKSDAFVDVPLLDGLWALKKAITLL